MFLRQKNRFDEVQKQEEKTTKSFRKVPGAPPPLEAAMFVGAVVLHPDAARWTGIDLSIQL